MMPELNEIQTAGIIIAAVVILIIAVIAIYQELTIKK